MAKKVAMMIGSSKKQTRTDKEMEFLVEKYLERHPDHDGPLDPDVICDWGIQDGIYVPPPPVSPKTQMRRRLSRHLNHRYLTDPQGREVRALHAVPYEEVTPDGVKQGYRYHPLFTTDDEKIRVSLMWRRGQAFSRVVQIENDRLSYNDNNTVGGKIEQIGFDFETQMAEKLMPTKWPDAPPDDHDADDDDLPPE